MTPRASTNSNPAFIFSLRCCIDWRPPPMLVPSPGFCLNTDRMGLQHTTGHAEFQQCRDVVHAPFSHHSLPMLLDGAVTDAIAGRDFFMGKPGPNPLKNVAFPRGQLPAVTNLHVSSYFARP